jgi:hypothetical protein
VNLTLSPQMKIVALVGVILVLALGAGSMLLKRSATAPVTVPTTPLKHFHPKVAAPAKHAVKPVAATSKSSAKPAARHAAAPAISAKPTSANPATKPAVKPEKKAVVPAVATNGLPGALDLLLHGHRVVVVALWDPEIPSDRYAFLEAEAGAKAANAGFLGVNVLDEKLSAPLTALVGGGTVLPSPGVLVYKQPAMLMNRIDGFADRDAIAEAVSNALMADAPAPGAVPAAATPAVTATVPATVPAP